MIEILAWFMNVIKSMTLMDFIACIINLIALSAAFEGSKPNANLLRMNVLFGISNAYSLGYFIFSNQFPYVLLNIGFLIIAIRGTIRHRKMNKNGTKIRSENKYSVIKQAVLCELE